MAKTLTDLVKELRTLLDEKKSLEAQTTANTAAIEAKKQEIIQEMIDSDTDSTTVGGYTYSLQAKTKYSKIGDEALAGAGVDFLDTLRLEGFGHLIKETVNAQTLQGAMSNFVDEHGELTDGLQSIIRVYDYNDVGCRKVSARKKGSKK